jgi:prepilin-type processing-associated H-X9-DG protein/prepilin-type N-terminal cleavage/methylation domain-containing protein
MKMARTKSRQANKELRALTLVELLVVIVVIAILAGLVIPAGHDVGKAKQAACQSNLKQIGIAYRTWEGDYGNKYPQELIAAGSTQFPLGSDPTGYILNHPLPTNTAVGVSVPYGLAYQCYQVMSNELNNPKVCLCPSDERPTGSIPSDFINLPTASTAAFNNDTVSYFVGVDADESRSKMLLGGDRNLLMNGVAVAPGLVVFGTNTPIGWSAKMHNGKGNILFADGSVQRTTPSSLQTFLSNTGTNVNRLAVP